MLTEKEIEVADNLATEFHLLSGYWIHFKSKVVKEEDLLKLVMFDISKSVQYQASELNSSQARIRVMFRHKHGCWPEEFIRRMLETQGVALPLPDRWRKSFVKEEAKPTPNLPMITYQPGLLQSPSYSLPKTAWDKFMDMVQTAKLT